MVCHMSLSKTLMYMYMYMTILYIPLQEDSIQVMKGLILHIQLFAEIPKALHQIQEV